MAESFTNLTALLNALAKAMNLVNPQLENHHQQTAYLTYMLTRAAGMEAHSQEQAVCAALLHDVGSIVSEEPESIAEIEAQSVRISRMGAQILSGIPDLEPIAEIIRYCQLPWSMVPTFCPVADAARDQAAHQAGRRYFDSIQSSAG